MPSGHCLDRGEIIMADAKAIGTVHRRATLVQEPEARAIAGVLAEYTAIRNSIRAEPADLSAGFVMEALKETTELPL